MTEIPEMTHSASRQQSYGLTVPYYSYNPMVITGTTQTLSWAQVTQNRVKRP